MEKSVKYRARHFDESTVRRAMKTLREAVEATGRGDVMDRLDLMRSEWAAESWSHDSIDELLADITRGASDRGFEYGGFIYEVFVRGEYEQRARVSVGQYGAFATVTVSHRERGVIERIHSVFRNAQVNLYVAPPPPPKRVEPKPRIFIGHGGTSSAWRDLKDHLADKHEYEVIAYETGARSGHTIRDILEEMLSGASFAVLVMTAEDLQANGETRARQNVIHEAGLFQGKLGFARAIVLRQSGVENFSNIDGVQYLEYSHTINETFGDVLATLRREFSD